MSNTILDSVTRNSSLDSFRVGYVTTFVEAERPLEIPKLLLEITNLCLDNRFGNPCILETTTQKLRAYDPETDVVIEEATWDTLVEPPLLIPLDSQSENDYILLFRIRIANLDLNGYTHQLPVFIVEGGRVGKNIQDRVAFHKTRFTDVRGGFTGNQRERRTATLADRKPQERIPFVGDYSKADYDECLYLLNRCLNDIEWVGGKLDKYLKKLSDASEPLPADEDSAVQPPHRDELIECIRKIKYAFNMNQMLEPIILTSADKIYVRLIKLVRWFDKICQNGLIADYPPTLVSCVVEPPLSESAIEAVLERLTPAHDDFWSSLGDAWNRSSKNWESPLSTYVPHFKTMPRKQQFAFVPKQPLQYSSINASPELLSQRTPPDSARSNRPMRVTRKASLPLIRNSDHERYYKKIQERGGRLCFATVEHVKAVSTDLPAKRGELFEVLDDTRKDWWKLENYQGETGFVPRWKLRPTNLNASGNLFTFSPYTPLTIQPSAAAFGDQNITSYAHHWEVNSLPTTKPEIVIAPSSASPSITGNQRTDASLSNWTPLVVYIPKEIDRRVTERTQANPMILMPYGSEQQETRPRPKPDSNSSPTMTPPINVEKRSKPPQAGQHSAQFLTQFSHPHSPMACKPTMLLETK